MAARWIGATILASGLVLTIGLTNTLHLSRWLAPLPSSPGLTDKSALTTRIYPIADLVSSHRGQSCLPGPEVLFAEQCSYTANCACASPLSDFPSAFGPAHSEIEHVIQLLESVLAPASWHGKGGEAAIFFHPDLRALVVSQSAGVHDGLLAILRQLRQHVHEAVELECLVVWKGKEVPESVVTWPDAEVGRLGKVLARPRVRVPNGQPARLELELTGGADANVGSLSGYSLELRPFTLGNKSDVHLVATMTLKPHAASADLAAITASSSMSLHGEQSGTMRQSLEGGDSILCLVRRTPTRDTSESRIPGGAELSEPQLLGCGEKEKQIEELLDRYHSACAEGCLADAKEIAANALALDSACFHVDRARRGR